MQQVILTPEELFYLCSSLGAAEIFGVDDVFYGMTDAEIAERMQKAGESLGARGFAQMDFDGIGTLEEELLALIRPFALCRQHIVSDITVKGKDHTGFQFYSMEDAMVRLIKNEDGTLEVHAVTGGEAASLLTRAFHISDMPGSADAPFIAQQTELDAAKRKKDIRTSLTALGCGEAMAEIIAAGLREEGVYHSVVATDFTNMEMPIQTFLCLSCPNGMLQIVPVLDGGEESMEFRNIGAEDVRTHIARLLNE
ncbi:MAG: hypothetical protein FWF10_04020 [Clostridiales bacterium]|nr:hypothetical protein [Clostridiales bacterium]